VGPEIAAQPTKLVPASLLGNQRQDRQQARENPNRRPAYN